MANIILIQLTKRQHSEKITSILLVCDLSRKANRFKGVTVSVFTECVDLLIPLTHPDRTDDSYFLLSLPRREQFESNGGI